MDRADVRVIECRKEARLAFEAGEPFRIGRERARQHFDGDVAAKPGVARPIHLAHSALTEQCLQVIDTDAPAYPVGVDIIDHRGGDVDSRPAKKLRHRRLV